MSQPRRLRGLLSLGTGFVAASVALSAARAADFDASGALVPAPDRVFFLDFEEDLIPPDGGASLTVVDAGALSGARVLELGAFGGVDVPVTLLDADAEYAVSVWIKGGETVADVEVTYPDNAHSGVDELATLYPTGRMTSDGWVELANDHVRVMGSRAPSVSVGFFAASGAQVDALEIRPLRELAPDEKSGAACTGSGDPTCGDQQICLFSQCRYVGGQVPDLPKDDDVRRYLGARLELLFGPLHNRALDLPNARLALARMENAPDPWTYWNGFTLAIRRLHDGHTTTSSVADFVFQNEKPIGVCFLEGDADLSHGVAPADPQYLDVLVSHTSGFRDLGLAPGDRLVAVDGLHPIAWARAQVEQHWGINPTSNHATFAELAEQLRGLLARYAARVDVVRCDAALGTCGPVETIDMTAIPAIAEGEPFESVSCDNRPLRHLADSPADHASGGDTVYHGLLLESDPGEAIYGAEWESLYTTTGNDYAGPGLKAAVAEFKASANGVILDHRSGNGGTLLANDILWNFAVPRHPVTVYLDRQHKDDEEPSLADGLGMFQAGVAGNYADYAGSQAPTTKPIALLTTRDVSASDWLPLGMKGVADNVKVFAPFETNGGFSTRYVFGYWLGVSYVIAVGDSFDATGQTRNGRGVTPDFVVLPKQSDLLVGKDTVFEAALAWVRGELP